jgi:hypothetical protein
LVPSGLGGLEKQGLRVFRAYNLSSLKAHRLK